MNKLLSFIFVIVGFLCIHETAYAIASPLSISIVSPIQFPSQDFTVTGARLSVLWGTHRDIYGLDLGVIGNITKENFVGMGISGIFNLTEGKTTILGLQAAGLANVNTKEAKIIGLQIALALN